MVATTTWLRQPAAPAAPAPSGFRVLHINGGVVVQQQTGERPAIDARRLTDRERQILSLVAEGQSNKDIGAALFISERTLKNHLTYIMTKLQASDRTPAVVTAVRMGWLAI